MDISQDGTSMEVPNGTSMVEGRPIARNLLLGGTGQELIGSGGGVLHEAGGVERVAGGLRGVDGVQQCHRVN